MVLGFVKKMSRFTGCVYNMFIELMNPLNGKIAHRPVLVVPDWVSSPRYSIQMQKGRQSAKGVKV